MGWAHPPSGFLCPQAGWAGRGPEANSSRPRETLTFILLGDSGVERITTHLLSPVASLGRRGCGHAFSCAHSKWCQPCSHPPVIPQGSQGKNQSYNSHCPAWPPRHLPPPPPHCTPATRASSLFLQCTRCGPAPGPLHGLCLCPAPSSPRPPPSRPGLHLHASLPSSRTPYTIAAPATLPICLSWLFFLPIAYHCLKSYALGLFFIYLF